MVNVGKREDAMLDTIGLLTKNKHAALWWLADYGRLGLLSPELADHLRWELTKTEENQLEQQSKIEAVFRGTKTTRVSGWTYDGNPELQRGGVPEDGEAP